MRTKKFSFSSRKAFFEEKRSYRRLFVVSLLIILLFLFFTLLGIPLLVRMSAFLSSFGGPQEPSPKTIQTILFPPRFEALPLATNSAQITLRGIAESGMTVKILLGNRVQKEVITDKEGKFTAQIELQEGENKIKATAEKDSQSSQISEEISLLYKKAPPLFEVTEPQEGASFRGEDNQVKITGKTEPDVGVTINDRWMIVGSDGSFTTSLPLSPGENTFKIVATDRAGNQTTMERKVIYNP